jgi:putative DNA methylase
MIWDFAENNVFAHAAGDYQVSLGNLLKALARLPALGGGVAVQADAQIQAISGLKVVSTDPPYYDNIGYADLSDFFYVWLRRSLRSNLPELVSTLAVPKQDELVATPYRHGGKEQAESFFLNGMTAALHNISELSHPAFPVTIYYAFKQADTDEEDATSSSGWVTFLDAVMKSGFALGGTWPMRTVLYCSGLPEARS